MLATITLEIARYQPEFFTLRNMLVPDSDLRRSMDADNDVCIECEIRFSHQPREPEAGFMHGGPVVDSVTWTDEHNVVYDVQQFFDHDELLAAIDNYSGEFADVDMAIDAAREKRHD